MSGKEDDKDTSADGRDEKKGVVFAPRRGSALFWVNLHANGTGDERTVHAGLPLNGGRKTGMNLWGRVFFEKGRNGWVRT